MPATIEQSNEETLQEADQFFQLCQALGYGCGECPEVYLSIELLEETLKKGYRETASFSRGPHDLRLKAKKWQAMWLLALDLLEKAREQQRVHPECDVSIETFKTFVSEARERYLWHSPGACGGHLAPAA